MTLSTWAFGHSFQRARRTVLLLGLQCVLDRWVHLMWTWIPRISSLAWVVIMVDSTLYLEVVLYCRLLGGKDFSSNSGLNFLQHLAQGLLLKGIQQMELDKSQVNIKCYSQSIVVPITERIRIVGTLIEGSDSYLADPVFLLLLSLEIKIAVDLKVRCLAPARDLTLGLMYLFLLA